MYFSSENASATAPKQLPYWLCGTALWLLLVGCLGAENFASIDLWGKLSIPVVWFASHTFPLHDAFSFTAAGKPWTDHEWLSGFAFYQSLMLGGDMGLTLLKMGMTGLMIGAIFRTARLRHIPAIVPFVILWLGLPMLVAGLIATGRPQLFTFSLIPVLLVLLETVRIQQRYRLLGWLFPLFLLWANLHGGFVAGLGILGCYALGEAWNRKPFWPFLGGMLLVLLASLINPYGMEYWHYLLYAITLPRPEITEWQPVKLWNLSYGPLKALALFTVLGIGGLLFQRLQKKYGKGDWVLLLLFPILLHQAFGHIKHQPIFVVSAAALLPLLYLTLLPNKFITVWQVSWIQMLLNRWIPGLLLLGSLLFCTMQWTRVDPWMVQVRSENIRQRFLPYKPYPVGAIRYLEASPYHGNLLTSFSWGEFAYWRLYPRFRVSLDGRLEAVYPMQVFQQVETFYRSRQPDSWKIPEQLGAQFILSERKTANSRKLLHTGQWVRLYEDRYYLVLGKRQVVSLQQSKKAIEALRPVLQPEKDVLPVSAFFEPNLFFPRFQHYRP